MFQDLLQSLGTKGGIGKDYRMGRMFDIFIIKYIFQNAATV